MEILTNPVFALFLIICIGFLLGRIKFLGISFDVSAVIFVALVFGHYGTEMPPIIEKIGMVLFIFTVGIQAGPGFFDSFRKNGRELAVVASVIIIAGGLSTLAFMYFLNLDSAIAVGILCGALTSTPGLTVAIETTASPLASIGYGIAYPFGVVGVILFVKILPKLLRADIKKETESIESELLKSYPVMVHKHFRVDNHTVFGRTLRDLRVRTMTGATISRVKHVEDAFTPSPETILHQGDILRAVGTEDSLKRFALLIGPIVDEDINLGKEYEVQSVLVTNTEVVNRALDELNLHQSYNAVITRIRRSGIDIAPSPNLQVKFGDKLLVACRKEDMKQIVALLGNNDQGLSDTDFFPIAAGIVLGILAGQLQLSFPGNFTFSLGLSGGILLVAILLSSIGRTGPVVWTMTGSANQLLRQMGLLLFLTGVGTSAGAHLVETVQTAGLQLLFIGVAITLIPMIVAAVIGRYVYKLNILHLLGTITGGMTSTPGLAACDSMTNSNVPSTSYAAVYPIAMVVLIILVQILSLIQF